MPSTPNARRLRFNMRYLLFIAGMGGLLYGIDVGIIAGALPYLEATSGLTSNQLSIIVAAVLLGSVISTLFAGLLADVMGRKKLMILSGLCFVVSIPMIALAQGFGPLVMGRLLQGISAGLVGVVVPLYLAECLGAANRGKGTGVFQWLLTLGILAAAVIAYAFSFRVEHLEKAGNVQAIFAFKDFAWRSIFWISIVPGLVFVIGAFFVAESPRWHFRRGEQDEAQASLLTTRTAEEAGLELREMVERSRAEAEGEGQRIKESLFKRKVRHPLPAGLRDPGLQPGHRHQLHHWLPRHDSHSGGPGRQRRPPGLRAAHSGELPDDHGRGGPGG